MESEKNIIEGARKESFFESMNLNDPNLWSLKQGENMSRAESLLTDLQIGRGERRALTIDEFSTEVGRPKEEILEYHFGKHGKLGKPIENIATVEKYIELNREIFTKLREIFPDEKTEEGYDLPKFTVETYTDEDKDGTEKKVINLLTRQLNIEEIEKLKNLKPVDYELFFSSRRGPRYKNEQSLLSVAFSKKY